MVTTKQSFHKHFFNKVVCSFLQVLVKYACVAAQLWWLRITKCICNCNRAIVFGLVEKCHIGLNCLHADYIVDYSFQNHLLKYFVRKNHRSVKYCQAWSGSNRFTNVIIRKCFIVADKQLKRIVFWKYCRIILESLGKVNMVFHCTIVNKHKWWFEPRQLISNNVAFWQA